MKNWNYLILSVMTAAAFLCGMFFQKVGVPAMSKTTYLKLQEPLLLESEGKSQDFHVLPAGTALYKDRDFPEGFTRYIVYLNIKAEVAAEEIVSDKPNLVAPIWGHPVQRDDLPFLLANTPVTKDDLVRILKARKMSREELAQIVREWKE
jgi:hypothetical protein